MQIIPGERGGGGGGKRERERERERENYHNVLFRYPLHGSKNDKFIAKMV